MQPSRKAGRSRRLALALTLVVATAAAAAAQNELPDDFFDALEYRFVGPIGNRVAAVVGEPGDPNVYHAGAASGGIWKTTDGGVSWKPTMDEHEVSSIGALAVAPSDPHVVWAGTGESFIRANISIGDGIYRSTDRGETWERRGLEKTGRIGRVIIHPDDPDVVFAAALGHIYGPQQERGVFRTRDGGATWQRVLFVDENTGASDILMDPNNPRILFAGLWEVEINTWSRRSGGPGSSLWKSVDGGDSWTRLEGGGLPDAPWGKIGLTMSAADSNRIYALIETSSNRDFAPSDPFQGVLWRSDDAGATWEMVSADNNLVQRPLYYSRALAMPDDADEVHFMSVRQSTSLDGGKTSFRAEAQPGWDHHDMWVDPQRPGRMIVGHDGGVSISTNRGESWLKPQLPIAQMYHVNVDERVPYFLYGNRQDGPSTRGPSNSLTGGEIPVGEWRSVGGCEVGFAVPDPVQENLVWTGCFDGILELHDLDTGHSRNVSPQPDAIESWPGEDLEFRFQWTFPIAISPHDHRRVYVGSQYVHQTENEGQSWELISPDLTTDDPELQRRTGGLTLDDAGPTLAPTLFAIAESPLEEGSIWAGTNDGLVQLTRDGGETWTNVTANLPDLPPRGTISNVHPSPHRAGTAYLTVDRHQLGDTDPYVYKTSDWGTTFTRIDADIPRTTFSYAHCVIEDPVEPGLLYLGTESGVWVSFDDGASWRELQTNLPHAPVHWLVVQEHFNDLVVATYGRGFWILDDLTPVQQLKRQWPTTATDQPVLFAPRPGYRFRHVESPMSHPDSPAAGRNPPYGAALHYLLPERPDDGEAAADEAGTDAVAELADAEPAVAAGPITEAEIEDDESEVTITVFDEAGDEVVTLDDLPSSPGLHRVWWDLRGEKTRQVKLRTSPDENPHVEVPTEGWRELSDGGQLSILMPPGAYTVRLQAGETVLEEKLEIWKDPRSSGSEIDIAGQMVLLRQLWDQIDEAARIINEIEWIRKQLDDFAARIEETERADREELIAEATKLDDALRELEYHFFDLRLTGARQDSLRWKRLLYARLAYLARNIGQSDFPPTDAQRALAAKLGAELDRRRARFEAMIEGEVADFNALLLERGVGGVIISGEG